MMKELRSHDLAPRRRIMIQQLNGLEEIDPAGLLPPEQISEHLILEDTPIVNDEEKYEATLATIPPATLEDQEADRRDERTAFWLPRDVCLVN